MEYAAAAEGVEEADEFERFMELASSLGDDQLRLLATIVKAACLFETAGDEASLEQLFSPAPATLRRV